MASKLEKVYVSPSFMSLERSVSSTFRRTSVITKVLAQWGAVRGDEPPELHGVKLFLQENSMYINHTGHEYDSDYIDSSHIYDILSLGGQRLFSAVKTFEYENCDKILQLDVSILEPQGEGVISIKADAATIHVRPLYDLSEEFQEEIGVVYNRTRGFWSNHEQDVFVHGKKEFKIIRTQSKLNKRGEFTILRGEDGVKCGEIGLRETTDHSHGRSNRSSRSSVSSLTSQDSGTISFKYGVIFTEDMTVNQKAVLLGAMVFLYFENFDSISGQLRPGPFTSDRICCGIFGIIFFIVTIVFLVIAFLRLTDPAID